MKTNLDRWIREQEAACRRTTKGRWRLSSDAQGPCMVMHPKRSGVAIATLTLTHLPANGVHEPGARKPSPCPEASGGTTYLPERVANARFIAGAHDSMPVALRLIRAASAAGAGEAMQAALNEMLAHPSWYGLAASGAPTAVEGNSDDDDDDDDDNDGPPAADDDSDRAMFWRQDREQAQIELARKKNIGRAGGEPEFAPCGDCGHVHNESLCPRCEGDGEEDLSAPQTTTRAVRRARKEK